MYPSSPLHSTSMEAFRNPDNRALLTVIDDQNRALATRSINVHQPTEGVLRILEGTAHFPSLYLWGEDAVRPTGFVVDYKGAQYAGDLTGRFAIKEGDSLDLVFDQTHAIKTRTTK
jgi:hypothetical protein